MERKTGDYDCCYEYMTDDVGGQSQPQPYWNPPLVNNYEETRKGYDKDGLDWSGMKGNK